MNRLTRPMMMTGTEMPHALKQAGQSSGRTIGRGIPAQGRSAGVSSGQTLGYQPAANSMKAYGRGGTVGGGQAPRATAAAPATRPTAAPKAAGQAEAAGARVNQGQTIRERLFGTNDVAEFSAQRVRPIGNNRPRNHEYAGKTFYFDKENLAHKLKNVKDPSKIQELTNTFDALHRQYPHGVHFSGNGHIDLSRYAQRKVEIPFSGNTSKDIRMANKLIGYKSEPSGFTWHHHHDGKTMLLVDTMLHDTVKHTGGNAITRALGDMQ